VLVDLLGRFVAGETFPTTRRGLRALIRWAQQRGTIRRAGVEGTGSYGAGLTRALMLESIEVVEVTEPLESVNATSARTTPATPRPPPAASCQARRPRSPKAATESWSPSACCAMLGPAP
jgi:transposase